MVTGKFDDKKRTRGRGSIRWTDQMRTAIDANFQIALHLAKENNDWPGTVKDHPTPKESRPSVTTITRRRIQNSKVLLLVNMLLEIS